MTACDRLHCDQEAGPDGCFCDPERPFCASCLTECPTCRREILSDEPFHVQAARYFAEREAWKLEHGQIPRGPFGEVEVPWECELSEATEPLPYEPYASDGVEADHAADEELYGMQRAWGVA